ncbi:MAG: Methionyl-tRNA formyltransferase [Candidatus Anoxychlamydiales bacterium]|nr:Methionyl-tRNA formyltransferase [Candidatus Anoxychlamydiales bacterium]
MKIVLIGRGHIAKHFFATLLNSRNDNFYNICGVVTEIINPFNEVICHTVYNFAKHANLNVFTEDINSVQGLQWLEAINPDLGIMFGYPKKLKKDVITIFKKFILNVHPSDLPKNRGLLPLHQQIINNDPLVITIHKVDVKLDTGPWLLKTAPLDLTYLTNEEVYGLVKQQATLSTLKALELIRKNTNLKFHSQNNAMATYANGTAIIKIFQKINWENNAKQICDIIRAAGIRSGIPAFLVLNKEKRKEVKIHSAYFINQKHNHSPGCLISIENSSYKVATNDGFVIIEDLRNSTGDSFSFSSDIPSFEGKTEVFFN